MTDGQNIEGNPFRTVASIKFIEGAENEVEGEPEAVVDEPEAEQKNIEVISSCCSNDA